jgi:hypothetical protein
LLQPELNIRQKNFFREHDLGIQLLRPTKRLVPPYTWVGHIPFAQFLIRIMRPRVIVELGTHSGNSFCAFCQAVLDEGLEAHVYAVDTWEGDAQAGHYDDSVLNDLAPYVRSVYGNFANLLRMTFDDGLRQFSDGSVDLLHIDGLHTYEAVRRDYEAWKDKLSPRGVVLFHDTQVFDRDFGVYRLWSELQEKHPGFEFLHSHGLGVLMVGNDTVPAVAGFIHLALENPDPIQLLFERISRVWLPDEAIEYQRQFASERTAEAVILDCELYLDCGKGFGESNKLIYLLRLENNNGVVQYDLGRFCDHLLGLRFDPGHEAIALHSISAWGRCADGRWDELKTFRDSAVGSHQEALLFAADPWIEFAVPNDGIEAIKIELQVKAVGPALVELLIDFTKQIVDQGSELTTLKDAAKKLWGDLAEKDRLLAEQEASGKKLWNDMAEKDRLLAEQEASCKKLWSDLVEKDREIEMYRHSLEMVQALLNRVKRHPVYRLFSRFNLLRSISLNKEGK